MNSLKIIANQLRNMADAMDDAAQEIALLRARCDCLENENDKNRNLKRDIFELLKNDIS